MTILWDLMEFGSLLRNHMRKDEQQLQILRRYKAHYRRNAVWIINDETALYLRTLKDSSGNYLWNHFDNTILGKPVEYSNYIPGIESGNKVIAFGDFSYFWIVDRQSLSVKVLKEKYILEGQIGYAAYERLDAKLIVPEAVKILQLA